MNTKTLRKRISIVSLFVLLLSSCGGPNPTLDDLTFGDELSKEESNEILNECLKNTKENSSEYTVKYFYSSGLYNPKNNRTDYDATVRRYKNKCFYTKTRKYNSVYSNEILKERTVEKEGGSIIYNDYSILEYRRVSGGPNEYSVSVSNSSFKDSSIITKYFHDFTSYSNSFVTIFTGYRNGDGYTFVNKTYNEEQTSYMYYEGGTTKNGTGTTIKRSQSIYYCNKNKEITDYVSLSLITADFDSDEHKKFNSFVEVQRNEVTIRVKYDELREYHDFDYLVEGVSSNDLAISSFSEKSIVHYSDREGGEILANDLAATHENTFCNVKTIKNIHVVNTLELTTQRNHGSYYCSHIMLNPTLYVNGYILSDHHQDSIHSYSNSYSVIEQIVDNSGVTFHKIKLNNYEKPYYYIPIGKYSTLLTEYDMVSDGANINFQNVKLRLE